MSSMNVLIAPPNAAPQPKLVALNNKCIIADSCSHVEVVSFWMRVDWSTDRLSMGEGYSGEWLVKIPRLRSEVLSRSRPAEFPDRHAWATRRSYTILKRDLFTNELHHQARPASSATDPPSSKRRIASANSGATLTTRKERDR
jgi:hypothetical protein